MRRLFEQMMLRPMSAFISSMELLGRDVEARQRIDGMISRMAHNLSRAQGSRLDLANSAPARPARDARADAGRTAPDGENNAGKRFT